MSFFDLGNKEVLINPNFIVKVEEAVVSVGAGVANAAVLTLSHGGQVKVLDPGRGTHASVKRQIMAAKGGE